MALFEAFHILSTMGSGDSEKSGEHGVGGVR